MLRKAVRSELFCQVYSAFTSARYDLHSLFVHESVLCYARYNDFSPGYNRKLEGRGVGVWAVCTGNMTDHLPPIQVVIKYSGKSAGGDGVICEKTNHVAG